MKDFIGINARSSDDFRYIKKFGFVREYHEWSDDTGFDTDNVPNCPKNLLGFNPSKSQAAVIDLDDFYKQLSGRVSPSFKGLAPEMRGLQWYNPTIQEQKPICPDQPAPDQNDPATYWDYAKWVSIHSARYGGNAVCNDASNAFCRLLNQSVLNSEASPSNRSGLNYLKYMEIGNEPDKWWYDDVHRNTPEALYQMMPRQNAAMLSAAYDGAGKSPAFRLFEDSTAYLGIKNIDPDIKVAMGGLSEFRGRYMIELLESAYALRASNPAAVKKIPFDILNIHHYCSSNPYVGAAYINQPALWNNYDYFGFNDKGVSPEQCQLRKRYERFLERLITEIPTPAVREELLRPGAMQYWLSEFGYDTNKNSWVRAALNQNSQSYFTTQAQWLVRSYLELAAVEYEYEGQKLVLDKVAAFDLRDVGPQGEGADFNPEGGLFTHSGVMTNDFKPKRSWYYVQTLINALGDTRFAKDLNPDGQITFSNGGTAPRIFYFTNQEGKKVLAIWSPTSNKTSGRELSVSFEALAQAADDPSIAAVNRFTVIQTADHTEPGVRKGFLAANGILKLDASSVTVSETPIYVVLGQKNTDLPARYPFPAAPVVTGYCSEALLSWNTATITGGTWNVLYARKSMLPNYTNCADYKNVDLLGNGVVQTFRTNVPFKDGRLLVTGLKPGTDYVFFLIYVNSAGIAAAEPGVLCFHTTETMPCVFNPCFTLRALGDCAGAYLTDYCKLAIDNAGATQNTDCSSEPGLCTGGDPKNAVSCAAYSASAGCGYPFLYSDLELWSVCNKPEIELAFQNPVRLDAVKFFHHSGSDLLEIRYSSCQAPFEKKYLTTFRPNSCNTWVNLTENMPREAIVKLYFRKINPRDPALNADVKIGKLHFCGVELNTDCGDAGGGASDEREAPGKKMTGNVRVFPNPANELTEIEWNQASYARLRVLNAAGGLVMQQILPEDSQQFSLDVRELPAGIYVFELSGDAAVPVQKQVFCKN